MNSESKSIERSNGAELKEVCKYCPGYRFDQFMDDTYYCSKYKGQWDEFKLSRKCAFA